MSEQCEDGNIVNGDGCGSSCTLETGWTCTVAPIPNSCTPICGDGKRVGSEICDDGSILDTLNCLPDCTGPEPGFFCSGGNVNSPTTCI